MFVSVDLLHEDMGVDKTIARFFVDRKVPQNNVFWKKRLLYVGRGNGYISIPVYYDILYRLNVPREQLLDEIHVQLMEKIMHYAILVEYAQMSFADQLQSIKHLLTGRIKNEAFYYSLVAYLDQPILLPVGKLGMPIPSLNRADVFLFILCDLPLSDEQIEMAVSYWYSLHPSYLLMDDIYDYRKDKQNNEENSILELGEGSKGFEKAFYLLKKNTENLHNINPVLAGYFEESISSLYDLIP